MRKFVLIPLALALVVPSTAQAGSYASLNFDSPSHNLSCRIVERYPSAYVQCAVKSMKVTVYMENNTPPNFRDMRRSDIRRQWVLNYGWGLRLNRFRCKSMTKGMRCWNTRTQEGFLVSREAITTFPNP